MTPQNNKYKTGYKNTVSLEGTGINPKVDNRNDVYKKYIAEEITSAQYHQFLYEQIMWLTSKDIRNK